LLKGIGRPALSLAAAALLVSPGAAQDAPDLLSLTIEELGELEVTTASRRATVLSDTPAAAYVITRDEIRRSGVRSLPEALRLAPGVEVAREGAYEWTVSMRGFNSDLSNKLLVLIDGRSVYSPLYAGVFWDAQSTFLEDIDRIEVIAGPGGTMWGANAVNGVINIITRTAWDSGGGLFEIGAGNENRAYAGVRYAGRLGDNGAARGYAQYSERDASRAAGGGDAADDRKLAQAGFRFDWQLASGALTLQGDAYTADQSALLRGNFSLGTLPETNVPGTIDISGHNVLARWSRRLAGGGAIAVRGYYDYTERDIPGAFGERRNTIDVDFQHELADRGRHELIWGTALRVSDDSLRGTQFATFVPESRRDRTYSLFVQDEIDLYDERLKLVLGTKLEHNDYTGREYQPNARLSWLATGRQTYWAAVSRAVRVPARLNEDLQLYAPLELPGVGVPFYVNVSGDDEFESEELLAREVGYRIAARSNLSFDIALYAHEYDRLQTNEIIGPAFVVQGPPAYLVLPIVQGNGMRGDVRGGTFAANWQPTARWRLHFQYSRIDFDLSLRPESGDQNALTVAGNSPKHQAALHSYADISRKIGLFIGARYVDELPAQSVPSYLAVDVNVDWRPSERWRASLGVRNLNDAHHPEFGSGNEIERSAMLRLNWTF
jgi:iron complex outermembrane recepter protein